MHVMNTVFTKQYLVIKVGLHLTSSNIFTDHCGSLVIVGVTLHKNLILLIGDIEDWKTGGRKEARKWQKQWQATVVLEARFEIFCPT